MNMTKLTLATALLVSASSMAFAKDPTDGKSEDLAVEKVICQQLYVHKPADDVAFKPGVDVSGKPVAPADLPASSNFAAAPGDFIEVPLTVDLAQKLDQPVPEGVKMEGGIGNLRLYKDGRISYNGQDVLPQANTMCGGELKTTEPTEGAAMEVAPAPGSTSIQPTQPAQAGATVPSATINPPPPPPPNAGVALSKKVANFTPKPVTTAK